MIDLCPHDDEVMKSAWKACLKASRASPEHQDRFHKDEWKKPVPKRGDGVSLYDHAFTIWFNRVIWGVQKYGP